MMSISIVMSPRCLSLLVRPISLSVSLTNRVRASMSISVNADMIQLVKSGALMPMAGLHKGVEMVISTIPRPSILMALGILVSA